MLERSAEGGPAAFAARVPPERFLSRDPAAAAYLDRFRAIEVRLPLPPPVPVVVETPPPARSDHCA